MGESRCTTGIFSFLTNSSLSIGPVQPVLSMKCHDIDQYSCGSSSSTQPSVLATAHVLAVMVSLHVAFSIGVLQVDCPPSDALPLVSRARSYACRRGREHIL